MTYIKFDQTHTGDERWLEAGADAFAVHAAALVYCDTHLTDGRISHAMATRCCLAVPPERSPDAVKALLNTGLWADHDEGGYFIPQYLEHAWSAEQIKRTRGKWSNDKARKRQHAVGDHSLCTNPKVCPHARSTVDTAVESRGGVSELNPTPQHPTRPNPTEGKGLGWGWGLDDARPGSAGAAPVESSNEGGWAGWREVHHAHRFKPSDDHPGYCGYQWSDSSGAIYECAEREGSFEHAHAFHTDDLDCDTCNMPKGHPVHPGGSR